MPPVVWVLFDEGKIGTLRQCEALVNGLLNHFSFDPTFIPVSLPFWARILPSFIFKFISPGWLGMRTSPQDLPRLIIGAGRKATALTITFRKLCPTIILQNPRINPALFGLVIAPYHDRVKGANVIETLGALSPINLQELSKFLPSPKKYITVLLGGNSKHYTYHESDFERMVVFLKNLLNQKCFRDARLLITPSRRTPEAFTIYLQDKLGTHIEEIWDPSNSGVENPYKKYLAWGNATVVTGDSISMMSESCLQGKPVFIFDIPMGHKKFEAFKNKLVEDGYAVWADQGNGEEVAFRDYNTLDEWGRIQERVIEFLRSQGGIPSK